jgi:myosin heavy subunit
LLQDLKKYKLGDPSSFHYLNQSACIKVDGINDAEEYVATRNAMDTVGITEQEQVSNSSSFCSVKNYPFNVEKCCTVSNY